MKPVYKRVKKMVMCCPLCKSEIWGNGSIISPYTCLCGEWIHGSNVEDWELIKK